jgi:catechol 2,3-dioxygenase
MLPSDTYIHHVHLRVSNLHSVLAFYTNVIGLQVIQETSDETRLSSDGNMPAQLILTEDLHAKPRNPRAPGLFHVAWRVPDRPALGRMIRHLAERSTPLQGFADHGVSEAVYLADPEGNGIEIYRDRPRAEWPVDDGRIAMVTEPLDVESVVNAGNTEPDEGIILRRQTDIGHIHLQVSDLSAARRFYHQTLGFDVTQDAFPGALFVSAGGYHHHIGLNVWNSRGVRTLSSVHTGLVSFAIAIPDKSGLIRVKERLAQQDVARHPSVNESFMVDDQDGLQVEVLFDSPSRILTRQQADHEFKA